MNSVEIYISGERLDLFPNENISMNVSTQSIGDISKSFSDFTQSFTVPATDLNNHIFKHYYNADIQGGFTATTRAEAVINVSGHLFREGGVELESVSLKNGTPSSYAMTFYGKVGNLKDIFGDDKMKDLDFSVHNFPFTEDRVKSGMGDFLNNATRGGYADDNAGIVFPFIFDERAYNLRGDNLDPNNFSKVAYDTKVANGYNAIDNIPHYLDLKPAISLRAILSVIESTYGIDFDGSILSAGTFFQPSLTQEMFLWLSQTVQIKLADVDMTSITDVTLGFDGLDDVNLTTNKWVWDEGVGVFSRQRLDVTLTSTHVVDLNIFVNGTYSKTLTFLQGTSTQQYVPLYNTGDVITFKLKPNPTTYQGGAVTISNFNAKLYGQNLQDPFGGATELLGTVNLSSGLNADIEVSESMPDIKVSDLFSGVLKMFNLVILYRDGKYLLESLGDYYTSEEPMDITNDVDITNMVVSKTELYKTIEFKYKDHKTFDNYNWFRENGRGFGDLRADFGIDGGELKVELPFENLIWRSEGQLTTPRSPATTNIAYSFDKTGQKQETAPMWFFVQGITGYDYPNAAGRPVFYSGVADAARTENGGSNLLIPDLVYKTGTGNRRGVVQSDKCLNFYAEDMPEYGEVELDTLYKNYWDDYLNQIYDNSRRVLTLTAILPLDRLLTFQSNSIVQIRDRKYIVDNAQINLTTGMVKMKLITNADDFTSLPDSSIYNTNSSISNINDDTTTA